MTTDGIVDGATAVRRIVVGVDGSETSRQALRWAADEALTRQAELQVVHAWEVQPVGAGIGMSPGRRVASPPESQHEEARLLVTDMVTEELTDHGLRNVRPTVGRGSPASVLIDAAHGADLLVVGSRGLGGFKGLLLGSVSTKMANHAPCPVVIVRPAAPQDED